MNVLSQVIALVLVIPFSILFGAFLIELLERENRQQTKRNFDYESEDN